MTYNVEYFLFWIVLRFIFEPLKLDPWQNPKLKMNFMAIIPNSTHFFLSSLIGCADFFVKKSEKGEYCCNLDWLLSFETSLFANETTRAVPNTHRLRLWRKREQYISSLCYSIYMDMVYHVSASRQKPHRNDAVIDNDILYILYVHLFSSARIFNFIYISLSHSINFERHSHFCFFFFVFQIH